MRVAGGGLALLLVAGTTEAAPLAGPTVRASRRGDVAVVVYREVIGEIAGPDRGPTLTIYGNGRMVAHYPAYMKRAGDWQRRLRRRELDALLASLAAKGVLDFDAPTVRGAARDAEAAARARARAARQPIALFEASDPSTTVIEMNVERSTPATLRAAATPHVAKRVVWTGLRTDAARFPDVAALRDLADAERELRGLFDSPRFRRVR